MKVVNVTLVVPDDSTAYAQRLDALREQTGGGLVDWWTRDESTQVSPDGVEKLKLADQTRRERNGQCPRWVHDAIQNIVFNTETLHTRLCVLLHEVLRRFSHDVTALEHAPPPISRLVDIVNDARRELANMREEGFEESLSSRWTRELAEGLWEVVVSCRDQFPEPEAPLVQQQAALDLDAVTREVLAGARCEGTTLELRCGELPPVQYQHIMKVLGGLGGKWSTQRRLHEFPRETAPLIAEYLATGKRRNIRKELQAFFTPKVLAGTAASKLRLFAGDIVCDPSVGHGALLQACWDLGVEDLRFQGIDIDDVAINRVETAEWSNLEVLKADFLSLKRWPFKERPNRIIMNPPFTGGQDVVHVHAAYEWLEPGGRMVAIMGTAWRSSNNRLNRSFRDFLEKLQHELYEIDPGTFKESGTNVATTMVVINKPKDSP